MKIRILILAASIMMVFSACAPTFNVALGRMPVQDPGAVIHDGVTTQSEVVKLFGAPDFKGVDSDGLVKWTWTQMSVEVKGGKDASITSFFNLEVSFKGDKVKSYSYSKKTE